MNDRSLERAATLRKAPIWLGLAAIVGLSWFYLIHMSVTMPGMTPSMPGMMHSMPSMATSNTTRMTTPITLAALIELVFTFVMWSVMMVAMMVPTAIPTIALFATLSGRRHPLQNSSQATTIYVSGYIAVWLGYAVLAAIAQWALTQSMLISPMGESNSASFSALILLCAGAFQFTSLKDACLTQCRSPLAFFMAEWRDGSRGAFVLGLRQGAYCVTCCWMLMALMFAIGVMNLIAMALLTAFLLVEKMAPPAWHISRMSGAVLVVWGAWIVAGIWI